MPTARHLLAAAAVSDRIYAIGGYGGSSNLATNEEYNPSTNTWATRASMPTARRYLVAAAVSDRIYAIGGYTTTHVATNEEYNPATNTWATKASMPTARYGLAAAAVSDRIYAIGGLDGSSSLARNEALCAGTYTIGGVVRDQNGNLVPGCKILVFYLEGDLQGLGYCDTNEQGSFSQTIYGTGPGGTIGVVAIPSSGAGSVRWFVRS
jgi:N-acetylneuraminic acid mutarotase